MCPAEEGAGGDGKTAARVLKHSRNQKDLGGNAGQEKRKRKKK